MKSDSKAVIKELLNASHHVRNKIKAFTNSLFIASYFVTSCPSTCLNFEEMIKDSFDEVMLCICLLLQWPEFQLVEMPCTFFVRSRQKSNFNMTFKTSLWNCCSFYAKICCYLLRILCSQMAMITGDNPLTACHVARELKFTSKKSTLVLTKIDGDDEAFEWQSIDQVVSPFHSYLLRYCDILFKQI